MRIVSLIVLVLLSNCAVDYRTDYEKNNNIVLSKEVVQIRKAQRKLERDLERAKMQDVENRERIQRMVDCAFQQSISSCY